MKKVGQKKAIILLVTLGIVMAIIILIAQSLKLLDSSIEDSKKFQSYNQTAILLSDLKKIMPNVLKDIKTAQDFEKITYMPLVFEEPDEKIKVELTIRPNAALDANKLTDANNTIIKEVFSNVLKKYKIKDEELFMSLLNNRSEIADIDKRFKKERFDSLSQWIIFVEYYATKSEDGEVLNIPWHEIVEFDGLKIDKTALAGNIALDGITISDTLLTTYSPQNYEFICEVKYNYGVIKDNFRFLYKSGVISNFKIKFLTYLD